jgi:hypothetical protein
MSEKSCQNPAEILEKSNWNPPEILRETLPKS